MWKVLRRHVNLLINLIGSRFRVQGFRFKGSGFEVQGSKVATDGHCSSINIYPDVTVVET
jgi:hypothetical protein